MTRNTLKKNEPVALITHPSSRHSPFIQCVFPHARLHVFVMHSIAFFFFFFSPSSGWYQVHQNKDIQSYTIVDKVD